METTILKKSKRQKTYGQQERYYYITKAIFRERLKFKDDVWLRNIDITTVEPKTARLVRRIIEKRMCQTYHKQHKDVFHGCGNKSRHNMKRAVSYELYILGQVEDIRNRSRGENTHWKRKYDPNTGRVVFKKKVGYNTIEEAKLFAIKMVQERPRCRRAVNVYRCTHCNQYHIGHESILTKTPIISVSPTISA